MTVLSRRAPFPARPLVPNPLTWLNFEKKWARFSGKESAAYVWPVGLTDDQILEDLLALNVARAAEEAHSASAHKRKPQRAKHHDELA